MPNSTRFNKDSNSGPSRKNKNLNRSWSLRISFNARINLSTNAALHRKQLCWVSLNGASTNKTRLCSSCPRVRLKFQIKDIKLRAHPRLKVYQSKYRWRPRNTWSRLLFLRTLDLPIFHSQVTLRRPRLWTKPKDRLSSIQGVRVALNLWLTVAARFAVSAKTNRIVKLLLTSFLQILAIPETPPTPRPINSKRSKETNTHRLSTNRWALLVGITPIPQFCSQRVKQPHLQVLPVFNKPNKQESSWEIVSSKFSRHRVSWDPLRESSQLTSLSLQGTVFLNQPLPKHLRWDSCPKMGKSLHSLEATLWDSTHISSRKVTSKRLMIRNVPRVGPNLSND